MDIVIAMRLIAEKYQLVIHYVFDRAPISEGRGESNKEGVSHKSPHNAALAWNALPASTRFNGSCSEETKRGWEAP
jgi:hypothetical protein